jgi:hypothetical protein
VTGFCIGLWSRPKAQCHLVIVGRTPGSAPDALVRPLLIPRNIDFKGQGVGDRLQTGGRPTSESGSEKTKCHWALGLPSSFSKR